MTAFSTVPETEFEQVTYTKSYYFLFNYHLLTSHEKKHLTAPVPRKVTSSCMAE